MDQLLVTAKAMATAAVLAQVRALLVQVPARPKPGITIIMVTITAAAAAAATATAAITATATLLAVIVVSLMVVWCRSVAIMVVASTSMLPITPNIQSPDPAPVQQ